MSALNALEENGMMKMVTFPRVKRWFVATALVVGLTLFMAALALPQPVHIFRKAGWMTALEKDGNVVVDHHGYQLDSDVRVLDGRGWSVSPSKLTLPVFVHVQYIFTVRGPTIIRLEVDPDVGR
jgi:hypothetical protein